MFLDFYGLDEQPFGVTPDPKFFFKTDRHCEALATLICGIEEFVGFAALFSEPGLGKTTILFQVLERYRAKAHTAFVFNTQCNGEGLLRQLAEELNLEGAKDPITTHSALRKLILNSPYALPVIVIIDEGQNLEDGALEAVRLLSDFETSNRKLVHFILAGQPELADKLARPKLQQLLDRLTTLSRLEALKQSEVGDYISHRLSVAGYSGLPIFTPEATAMIAAESKGVPRQINRICFNALFLGFALRQTRIGPDVIGEVLGDLDIRPALPKGESSTNTRRRLGRTWQPSARSFKRSGEGRSLDGTMTKAPTHPLRSSERDNTILGAQSGPVHQKWPTPTTLGHVSKRTELLLAAMMLIATAVVLVRYRNAANSTAAADFRPGTGAAVSRSSPGEVGPRSLTTPELLAPAHGPEHASTQMGQANVPRPRPSSRSRSASTVAIAISSPTIAEGESGDRDGEGSPTAQLLDGDNPAGSLFDATTTGARQTTPTRIREGKLIKAVRPVYPPLAARSRLEGNVLLAIVVDERGAVEAASAIRGIKPLADSALEAIKQWRFEPYSVNGKPLRVSLNVTIQFRATHS